MFKKLGTSKRRWKPSGWAFMIHLFRHWTRPKHNFVLQLYLLLPIRLNSLCSFKFASGLLKITQWGIASVSSANDLFTAGNYKRIIGQKSSDYWFLNFSIKLLSDTRLFLQVTQFKLCPFFCQEAHQGNIDSSLLKHLLTHL